MSSCRPTSFGWIVTFDEGEFAYRAIVTLRDTPDDLRVSSVEVADDCDDCGNDPTRQCGCSQQWAPASPRQRAAVVPMAERWAMAQWRAA